MEVLKSLKERIWIPYQVALEFQRRRANVISFSRKTTEAALAATQTAAATARKAVEELQLEKRGLGIEVQPLIQKLDEVHRELSSLINKALGAQLDISAADPIRDEIDAIIQNRIGAGPENQDALDEMIRDGEERYRERIPPGYEDVDKEKNPAEAIFFHNQIRYQKKFGDLILWRQLLAHVGAKKIKSVMFVTDDRKEDWWWREQGKTIGVHPELMNEIKNKAKVDRLWLYSTVQFVEHAKKYAKAHISRSSVEELEQISKLRRFENQTLEHWRLDALRKISPPEDVEESVSWKSDEVQSAVLDWLVSTGEVSSVSVRGHPDILIGRPDGLYGYNIVLANRLEEAWASESAIAGAHGGGELVSEGGFKDFRLVVVFRHAYFQAIQKSNRFLIMRVSIKRLIMRAKISGAVIGVYGSGRFFPLEMVNADDGLMTGGELHDLNQLSSY